jgi:hypothetical protein
MASGTGSLQAPGRYVGLRARGDDIMTSLQIGVLRQINLAMIGVANPG